MEPPPLASDMFDPMWFRLLVGMVIGLVLGSFSTMLSYRVPRRLSIITPPSHCPKCNQSLEARDLIPVLSWVIEGGKCRHCQSPISPRYLIIECVTAGACVLAFGFLGFTPEVIVALIGIVAIVCLATINLEKQKDN